MAAHIFISCLFLGKEKKNLNMKKSKSEEKSRKEKQKANFKRAIKLKNKLAYFIDNERMYNCARPRTLQCQNPACGAISLSKKAFTDSYVRKTRSGPICSRLQASEGAVILNQQMLSIMKDFYIGWNSCNSSFL